MQLSIIICTLNSARRLEKTLDSILSQNVDDFEIIIIDGASNDGTIDIIKDYETKFNGKLKWISKKDTGIYNAMNKGVKMAEGEYLKGYLAYNDLEFEKTHKLDILLDDISEKIDKEFKTYKDESAILTEYYFESRYPDFREDVSMEEAGEAIERARKIRDFVLSKIESV